MDWLCCVCLWEQAERQPSRAVTVWQGDAMCLEHLLTEAGLDEEGREVTR